MVAGAVLVGIWLVIVFTGILSRADELEASEQLERAQVEDLATCRPRPAGDRVRRDR
jgi:hypothetical protein